MLLQVLHSAPYHFWNFTFLSSAPYCSILLHGVSGTLLSCFRPVLHVCSILLQPCSKGGYGAVRPFKYGAETLVFTSAPYCSIPYRKSILRVVIRGGHYTPKGTLWDFGVEQYGAGAKFRCKSLL